MLAAPIVGMIILGQLVTGGTDAEASTLAQQLGSSRYKEREAAGKALCELGRTALPALRAARGARDPEVRSRASALIQKIEATVLTEATRVRLDFDDAPLVEVAKSLSQQLGARIALYPEELPRWRYQRVTLREAAPVSFWKALDQLCETAELEWFANVNLSGFQRETVFALADGPARGIAPSSDHGPFRVSLIGLHYQRDLNFGSPMPGVPQPPGVRKGASERHAPAPVAPRLNEQFTVTFQVVGEPRLALGQNGAGQVQLLEAFDNKGNSLLGSAPGGRALQRTVGYFGVSPTPMLQLQAQLRRPAGAGDSIKMLRGVIPLAVSSRRPDPLVVPLRDSEGKTFENADVQITVHAIRKLPNGMQTALELSVKSASGATADPREVEGFGAGLLRLDPQKVQIEVTDVNGRSMSWYQSTFDGDSSRVNLTLGGAQPGSAPKELRYYTVTRATVSVPFAFREIPMP
jgi:hypothetical protein